MPSDELDNVDKGILYLLQQNARRNTTGEIGEKVGVSSSTVGNRLNKLEEQGVIKGYYPAVDYQKTGLSHHLLLGAIVPLEEQSAMVDKIMNVSGVVSVRELLTNSVNLSIELVGRDREDIEQSLNELNALGVDIERTEIMKRERSQPYDHFGKEFTSEGETG